MKILAIDTSARFCSAGIYCSDTKTLLAKKSTDIGRGHAEVLIAHLDDCLLAAGVAMSELDRIAVTIGPGSFTGVRVGLATAKGLAIGLDTPVVGVSTLDAAILLAKRDATSKSVAAILDARRDQAYFQTDGGEPDIATWSDLAEMFAGFEGVLCGSGAAQLNHHLAEALPVSHSNESADIECVAQCSLKQIEDQPITEPIYLRSADAKKQTGAALPRQGSGA